jgi:hypothetical protein
MVNVWCWVFVMTVWILCWLDVDKVKWDFSVNALPEFDDAFASCMDGLISANDDIFSRLPFKASLPCNDVIRHHLFSSKFFYSRLGEWHTQGAFPLSLWCWQSMMPAFWMQSI